MNAYLITLRWDFAVKFNIVVLAKTEKSALNKIRKLYPTYEVVKIKAYMFIK